ncbi:hypothetical protein S40293_04868 [Stachybotrys chartarum IBT 40293]|nr:hypothetical protein S40293_04868 [Stachybotrys chartarum IBT 40293]
MEQARREMALILGLLTLISVLALLIIDYRSETRKALRRIPGPLYTSFTNLPLKSAVLTGRRTGFIHSLHQKYGAVVRISPKEISIVDPEASKVIHRAGSGFWKSDWYARFTNQPVPTLFTMADPKQHAERRRLLARGFSKSEVRARWEPVVRQTAERALDKMNQDLIRGKADILKWWLHMATDVSSHFMFGESFGTLETGKANHYFRVLQLAGKGGSIANEVPIFGFFGRYMPLATFRDLFWSNDYLSAYGAEAITKSMKQGVDTISVFSQLEPSEEPVSHNKSSRPLTVQDLSTEAGNLILAGTDTTAYTLTCLVWSVLRHPFIYSALHEEVAGLENSFTDSALEALPLLNAVINETLRLYGPASGSLPRIVPSGGVQLGGYLIQENTTVSTQAWTLHRNEDIWPNAET